MMGWDENNMLKQTRRTIFHPSGTDQPRQLQILQEFKRLKSQNEWMRQEVQHITMNLSLLLIVGFYISLYERLSDIGLIHCSMSSVKM
jgi:hypothetical protein